MATKKSSAKKPHANETLKNLFFAGLGLADEANDKLHQTFNELVKKGKAHEHELKKAADDIRKKIASQRKQLEKKFTAAVKQNDLVKSKEFQSLLKRIESLEVQTTPKKKAAPRKSKA